MGSGTVLDLHSDSPQKASFCLWLTVNFTPIFIHFREKPFLLFGWIFSSAVV